MATDNWSGPEAAKRRRVQMITYRAIGSEKLVRPDTCEQCGKTCKPDAAHLDYDKPFEIMWLCRSCHRLRDLAIKTPITVTEEENYLVGLTVYLPEDVIDWLQREAKANYISMSAVVRQILLRPRVTGRDQSARAD